MTTRTAWHWNFRRCQLIWWPWRLGMPRRHRWIGPISEIYTYSYILGPFELRIWKRAP
jgi:hypothetical protein